MNDLRHVPAPPGVAPGNGYSHVVSGRGRLVAVAGQVALDEHGAVVGVGDPDAQARQVFENLRGVLQAAGGDMQSLMKITTYITRIEHFPAVAEARSAVFQGELPASTLIVVKSLFHPDFLIEVEGVAAV